MRGSHACIAVTRQQNFSYSYGEIEKGGEIIPVTMVYLTGPNGAILDFSKAYSVETIYTPNISADKYLWSGVIDYTPKEFTLEETDAYPESNILFSDDDLPLTFVRYDRTEEELLPLLPWDAEEKRREDFEPGGLLELGLDVYAQDPPEEKADGLNLRISGRTPSAYPIKGLRMRRPAIPEVCHRPLCNGQSNHHR